MCRRLFKLLNGRPWFLLCHRISTIQVVSVTPMSLDHHQAAPLNWVVLVTTMIFCGCMLFYFHSLQPPTYYKEYVMSLLLVHSPQEMAKIFSFRIAIAITVTIYTLFMWQFTLKYFGSQILNQILRFVNLMKCRNRFNSHMNRKIKSQQRFAAAKTVAKCLTHLSSCVLFECGVVVACFAR